MSTDITNGYRLVQGTDPLIFIRKLRDDLQEAYLQDVREAIVKEAGWKVNHADLNGAPEAGFRPLSVAADEITNETRKRDWRGLNARFHLGADPETGRTHVLVVASRGVRSAFAAMPEVEEYAYWNASERPGTLTAAEWEDRRQAWDRLLPGAGVPSNYMVRFALDPDQFLMHQMAGHREHPNMAALLPSLATRTRAILLDRISTLLHRQNAGDDPASTVSFMRALTTAEKILDHVAFDGARQAVEQLLDPSDLDLFANGKHTGRLATRRDSLDELLAPAIAAATNASSMVEGS